MRQWCKFGVFSAILLFFVQSLSATSVHLGGISVGAGYSSFTGYPYYGFLPYYGDPFLSGWGPNWWGWGPLYAPGYYTGFAYQPNMGGIKLRTAQKTAAVYIDGAYAGTADKLKTMWLNPGAYQVELREGSLSFAQKVYVLSGKTLTVHAALAAPGGKE